ncbi:hypothetical protein X801_08131 [Opisthorchis viverrini]|uniref:Uncharacterized protein n=1 Tax=Opisthorchis viverrini TaxID=6198 RepID=A0A1S8WNM3_OPIVI|nr:hypothetical protein X801_08131 [Opisthorchis viverrini]
MDVAHAYERLKLTEEGNPVTTINTHGGLSMFNPPLLESNPRSPCFKAELKNPEKREKCDFLVDHADHLGFRISTGGLVALAEKIRSISKELQSRNNHEAWLFIMQGLFSKPPHFLPTELLATSDG